MYIRFEDMYVYPESAQCCVTTNLPLPGMESAAVPVSSSNQEPLAIRPYCSLMTTASILLSTAICISKAAAARLLCKFVCNSLMILQPAEISLILVSDLFLSRLAFVQGARFEPDALFHHAHVSSVRTRAVRLRVACIVASITSSDIFTNSYI